MSRRNGAGGPAATSGALFGEVLRDARERAGWSQGDLAAKIPCDRSLITRVEAGTRVPQEDFAKTCDELLGTEGLLLRLWRRIDWYPTVEHPDWFKRRASMDAVAVALRVFQTQLVPGLLQTEAYARALFAQVESDEGVVEERVSARMSRQQRFLSDGGPLLVAVLGESCIRQVVGGAGVMREQCAHLLTVGKRPNVRIQVAPFQDGRLVLPRRPMSLIALPDGHEWLYSESLDRGHFSDDPAVIARHTRTYDLLRADALSVPESAAVIREAMEGYGNDDEQRPQRGSVAQEQLQRQQRRGLHRNSPRFPRRRPRPRQ
ncbi:helix-turn-helix domain-containing protein [Streptomyces silvisoli]|uniref:Scr1 family TA system antitoxin-like transcriptional regulator n=1 Tax=Streptomyces silvisoli TaxID=3034235 RepID=A0ABT5ZFD3_9ACTN|nr:Scr1 family TA system antitoxin-like transcriptional regulator [Streptomyces silvisoli]MDF3288401.1 Scr1 family TA system antitoxin-like transcriptional regulator [Streptomyces silvisoli]